MNTPTKIMTKAFFIYLAALLLSQQSSAEYVIIQRPEKDKFADQITGSGIAHKELGSDLLSVYVRHCGNITLFRNSKGELPKDNQRVEYKFDGRCKISDWRSQ